MMYRLAHKSVNLRYSLVLTEIKPDSQFVEGRYSVMKRALIMEDLISNNICKLSKKVF